MSFLAPGSFLLGLLIPVIIAMYLLKLRRVPHPVASNYLWRRMVRDVEANAPWQKLRRNLLLILQLLFLALLILALARPYTWSEGAGGNAAIIIIDTSASMSAVDVPPSRIEAAKEQARQLTNSLPGNAQLTIIEAENEANVLLSSSLDRRQAFLAIDHLAARNGASNLGISLELASAIASRQPGTEIIVLSDGKVNLPEQLRIKGRLRFIPFGASAENQALSLLKLTPAANSETLTAFIQVTNYDETSASRRLSVFANDQLVNVFDLTDIPPGKQKSIVVEDIPPDITTLSAELNGQDALALDDYAVVTKPDAGNIPVTLVTHGNLFLKTALAILPGIQLTEQLVDVSPGKESPDQSTANEASTEAVATPTSGAAQPTLTIFDGLIPEGDLPAGNLLFIAPPSSARYFSVNGLVSDPAIHVIDSADSLLTNVSVEGINILDAVNIQLPAWAVPVITSDSGAENVPLLFRGEIDGRRIAVLAFDLRHSDLPLQVAFPLMLSNLVTWLTPLSQDINISSITPGESIVFKAHREQEAAQIIKPDKTTVRITPENNRYVFSDTELLGVYEIQRVFAQPAADNETRGYFSVNLFSPQESDIQPAEFLPGVTSDESMPANDSTQARKEWWRYLALLALGLLIGEWLVYHRAGLARLRNHLTRSPL